MSFDCLFVITCASQENETAFQIKQQEILEMKGLYTRQEMLQMKKDMEKSFENQQLRQMMERVMCYGVFLHILSLLHVILSHECDNMNLPSFFF